MELTGVYVRASNMIIICGYYDYPLTLSVGADESRLERPVSESIRAEHLLASYYKFGKNQLHIFKGLFKVVEYLQARYGLDLTKEPNG